LVCEPGDRHAREGLRIYGSGHLSRMSLVNPCIEPGCSTLCIGLFCVAHDAPPQQEFPRGRPWPPLRIAETTASRASGQTVLVAVRPAA